MDVSQIVTAGIASVALVVALLNLLAGRGDRNAEFRAEVMKEIAALTLQISGLRTELAQRDLAHHLDLQARYVGRTEFDAHTRAFDFVHRLNLEIHKRMFPDAAIHEPGASHG